MSELVRHGFIRLTRFYHPHHGERQAWPVWVNAARIWEMRPIALCPEEIAETPKLRKAWTELSFEGDLSPKFDDMPYRVVEDVETISGLVAEALAR